MHASHGSHKSAGGARLSTLHRLRRAGDRVITLNRLASDASQISSVVQMDSSNTVLPRSKGELHDEFDEMESCELDRVALRLDGFEMYSFLASLISGFSYGCLNDFDPRAGLREKLDERYCDALSLLFSLSMVFSIFSGLYATCIFALCSLYSKTALAEHKDGRMRAFLRDTAQFRTRGFRAFIVSLITFALNVVLILFVRLDLAHGIYASVLGLVCIGIGLQDIKRLLLCAAPIFAPATGDATAHGGELSEAGAPAPSALEHAEGAPNNPLPTASPAVAESSQGSTLSILGLSSPTWPRPITRGLSLSGAPTSPMAAAHPSLATAGRVAWAVAKSSETRPSPERLPKLQRRVAPPPNTPSDPRALEPPSAQEEEGKPAGEATASAEPPGRLVETMMQATADAVVGTEQAAWCTAPEEPSVTCSPASNAPSAAAAEPATCAAPNTEADATAWSDRPGPSTPAIVAASPPTAPCPPSPSQRQYPAPPPPRRKRYEMTPRGHEMAPRRQDAPRSDEQGGGQIVDEGPAADAPNSFLGAFPDPPSGLPSPMKSGSRASTDEYHAVKMVEGTTRALRTLLGKGRRESPSPDIRPPSAAEERAPSPEAWVAPPIMTFTPPSASPSSVARPGPTGPAAPPSFQPCLPGDAASEAAMDDAALAAPTSATPAAAPARAHAAAAPAVAHSDVHGDRNATCTLDDDAEANCDVVDACSPSAASGATDSRAAYVSPMGDAPREVGHTDPHRQVIHSAPSAAAQYALVRAEQAERAAARAVEAADRAAGRRHGVLEQTVEAQQLQLAALNTQLERMERRLRQSETHTAKREGGGERAHDAAPSGDAGGAGDTSRDDGAAFCRILPASVPPRRPSAESSERVRGVARDVRDAREASQRPSTELTDGRRFPPPPPRSPKPPEEPLKRVPSPPPLLPSTLPPDLSVAHCHASLPVRNPLAPSATDEASPILHPILHAAPPSNFAHLTQAPSPAPALKPLPPPVWPRRPAPPPESVHKWLSPGSSMSAASRARPQAQSVVRSALQHAVRPSAAAHNPSRRAVSAASPAPSSPLLSAMLSAWPAPQAAPQQAAAQPLSRSLLSPQSASEQRDADDGSDSSHSQRSTGRGSKRISQRFALRSSEEGRQQHASTVARVEQGLIFNGTRASGREPGDLAFDCRSRMHAVRATAAALQQSQALRRRVGASQDR